MFFFIFYFFCLLWESPYLRFFPSTRATLCDHLIFDFPYFPFEIVLKCVGIKEHFTKYLLTFAYMIHKWGNLVAYFSKQRTLDHKFPVRIPGWDDPFQMLDSLPFTAWKDVCELCGTIENTLGVGRGGGGEGCYRVAQP